MSNENRFIGTLTELDFSFLLCPVILFVMITDIMTLDSRMKTNFF